MFVSCFIFVSTVYRTFHALIHTYTHIYINRFFSNEFSRIYALSTLNLPMLNGIETSTTKLEYSRINAFACLFKSNGIPMRNQYKPRVSASYKYNG